MSVKHVQKYYDKIAQDYVTMKHTLDMMDDMLKNNPDIHLPNVEIVRQQVSALKENYMRISYIMHLLNMPNKKEKQKKYNKQQEPKLKAIPKKDTFEGVIEENEKALDVINSLIKN